MGAVTRDSTLYTNVYVDANVADARDGQGRAVPLPFEHTVVTEVSTDIVNLITLPANCEVVGFDFNTDGVGGTGTTITIGDAGDVDRFMLALDVDTAETPVSSLPFAGMRFRPAADTIVFATWGVDDPVAGNIIRGVFWIVPGA